MRRPAIPDAMKTVRLPYPVKSFWPGALLTQEEIKNSGVYFLEDRGEILYIGQAVNCMNRLKGYKYGFESNRLLGRYEKSDEFGFWHRTTCVHVMITPPLEHLMLEAAYILLLAPKLNMRVLGKGQESEARGIIEKLYSANNRNQPTP